MTVQDWFEKRKQAQIQRRELEGRVELDMDPDLWVKCVHCDAQLLKEDLEKNDMVCPVCDYHFRINARKRIKQLFDENSFEELFTDVKPTDPLEFVDTESYKNRLEKAHKKTGLNDAVITGIATIEGNKVATAVMDFDFMGGSMGSVVGEKVKASVKMPQRDLLEEQETLANLRKYHMALQNVKISDDMKKFFNGQKK